MSEPKVLLTGLGIPESPRWHDGRLWFCNWIDRQIVAVDMDGTTEVMPAPVEILMGWSIDWLPDGRLLMTGDKLRRQEPDGSVVIVADKGGNEIVVDGRGNTYVNGADFDFAGGEAPKPGYIKLVTPDGTVRQVADEIQFPNRDDHHPRRSNADHLRVVRRPAHRLRYRAGRRADQPAGVRRRSRPDGICLDAEGAVWTSTGDSSVVRVAEGGEVLQRVELAENRAPFALALGGPDRRTLFILTAEWRPADSITNNLDRLTNGPRTGAVLSLPVAIPGASRS